MIGPVQYASNMPVYLPSPVNRRHPLNRGLVAWYKVLPGWNAGNKWIYLMGLNPGTLTNMGTGSGWGGSPAPGGFGSLRFDGADDYVDLNQSSTLKPTGGLSVSALVLTTATLANFYGVTHGPMTAGGNGGWLLTGVSGGVMRMYVDTSGGGSFANATSTTVLATNTWYYVTGTWTAAAGITIYINGKSEANTAAAACAYGTTGLNAEIGRYSTFGNWHGSLDSVRFHTRALTPAEVWAGYLDERLGNPATLNRNGFNFGGSSAIPGAPYYYLMAA